MGQQHVSTCVKTVEKIIFIVNSKVTKASKKVMPMMLLVGDDKE